MTAPVDNEKSIRVAVEAAVRSYVTGFEARHVAQKDDPDGVINMKVHNLFITALGAEVQYYSALVRSLDSSLGDMLEGLAISIAKLSYTVKREVEGFLSDKQTGKIARLLEEYKRRVKRPEVADYVLLIDLIRGGQRKKGAPSSRHLVSSRSFTIRCRCGAL